MKQISSLVASLLFAVTLICGQAALGQASLAGKVAETMDAAGYTYVLVDTGTNKVWAAAVEFPVKKDDVVTVNDAQPMTDFHSKSLKRDFPLIYFSGRITVNGESSAAPKLPAGHPAIGGAAKLPEGHPPIGDAAVGTLPAGHPPVAGKLAADKVDFARLKPAKGGKTVAEIWGGSAKLAGQSVTIRGKAVKFNPDIMGRNWLHIQDGTGSAGSNDLLVTTAGMAKPGDTVLVEGKVAINQDFGAGYKYAVLIENAKVTVE